MKHVKISSSPPYIGFGTEVRVVVYSSLPIYKLWDLEEGSEVQVIMYAQGPGKFLSSSPIKKSWANKEDMKHDLNFYM